VSDAKLPEVMAVAEIVRLAVTVPLIAGSADRDAVAYRDGGDIFNINRNIASNRVVIYCVRPTSYDPKPLESH
jgi:hypothetical protein